MTGARVVTTLGRNVWNSSRFHPAVLVLATVAVAALALVGRADAFVYWANGSTGTIGRANLDGSGAHQRFIGGASQPVGLAVDGAHVYWANFTINRIGRADLDGSNADQSFITGSSQIRGVAVDAAHIYWTATFSNTIGRADLDGTGVDESFITGASAPVEVAVDGAHIYWTNTLTNSIGRASLDGTGADQSFITGASGPAGIAVDGPTIAELIAEVGELGLPHGIERSLLAKLSGAQRKLGAGRLAGVCGKLGAFVNEARAQTDKRIDAAEAAELVSQTSAVRASLGCSQGHRAC